MPKLYLTVSHHQPRLLATTPPGPETYPHDANASYVVLQPVVLEKGLGAPPSSDWMTASEYLRTWSAGKLAEGVCLLGKDEIELIKQGKVRPCSVPLPPGFKLEFLLEGKTRSGTAFTWSDERLVGGVTASAPGGEWDQIGADPGLGWPAFAVLSSALPVVSRYVDLDAGGSDGPQKRQAVRDLLGAFSRMATTWATTDPAEQDQRFEVWSTLVKPMLEPVRPEDTLPLSDFEGWWTYLAQPHSTGVSRAAWAYDTLSPFARAQADRADEEPIISLGTHHWMAEGVKTRSDLFLKRNGTLLYERSYLDALWTVFRGLAEQEEQALRFGKPPSMTVSQVLSQLFAFGERLAWPVARVQGGATESKRFMALRADLSHLTDLPAWIQGSAWLATNSVSLAGLVLRLKPWNAADPLVDVTEVALKFDGKRLIESTVSLKELLEAGFEELANVPVRTPSPAKALFGKVQGVQRRPRTASDLVVLFAPRKAALEQIGAAQAPQGRVLLAVPEALLDVVDDTARFVDRREDGSVRSNAPRRGLFKSELLDPGSFLAGAKDLWHRRSVELTPRTLSGSIGVGFALRLVEAVHPSEDVVLTWLSQLSTGTGHPEAVIWAHRKENAPGGEHKLPNDLLRRDADGQLLVLDRDPRAADSLARKLGYSATEPRTFQAELVFQTTRDASGLFDVVEPNSGETLPQMALLKAPVSRLSRSADRVATSLAVTWPTPFDPDYGSRNLQTPDMQTVQFSETNKLRLRLGLPAGGVRDLSDPDAQLPLPAGGDLRPWVVRGLIDPVNGPQGWYWLPEHFDQDSAGDGKGEETRFQLWNNPGTPLTLSGYLEHQFGHRVGIELPKPDLRRSSDLLSVADVLIPERVQAVTGDEVRRRPLFEVAEVTVGATNYIRVYLRRDALALALAQFDGVGRSAKVPGPLRDIYRSLAELRDATQKGLARIAVEPWMFNNRGIAGSGAATIGQGLEPGPAPDVALAPPGATTELGRLLASLSGKFDEFLFTARTIAATAGDPPLLWETNSAPLDKTASMIRVRLTLERPAGAKAEAAWSDGAFVPLADSGPEAGEALADVAQVDLKTYLESVESRLSKSVTWFEALDTERKAEKAGVGPGSSKFIVPAAETEVVDTVADFFWMPHAFVVPDAHPAFGDRRANADFLGFVLGIVQDVLAGRSIEDRVGLEPLSAEDAVTLRENFGRALKVPGNGAIERMLRLLRRVDPDPDPTKTDDRHLLHRHAVGVVKSLDRLGTEGPRAEIRARLLREPTLFSSLRGIAVGVFNRKLTPVVAPVANHTTFSSELIELAVTKHLIDDRGQVQHDPDQFTAADLRGGVLDGESAYYFLDLLPDNFYDDLVEIESAEYTGVDPFDQDVLGDRRSVTKIAKFGDTTARRGEDLLYPEDARISFAANAVHPFPDWRVVEDRPGEAKKLRNYYLLPERVVPPRAMPVSPSRPGVDVGRNEIALRLPDGPPSPALPALSPNAKWGPSYDNIAKDLNWVDLLKDGTPPKMYRRIERAANPTGPAKYLPAGRVDGGPSTHKWHLITTYLAHFWFELDLQKPGKSWAENLEDDTYEVEVELWPGTPAVAPEQETELEAIDDKLLKAFRQARPQPGEPPGPPPPITRLELQASAAGWLANGIGRTALTLLEEPKAFDDKALRSNDVVARTFRITRAVGTGAWRLTETTASASTDALGAVLGFEVMARTPTTSNIGPKYDDAVPNELSSVLIRLSVLDHPFRVSRARMRVVRNWRDVGSDGIPDIARDFFLADRVSAWQSEGRTAVEINDADFEYYHLPAVSRQLRATSANALRTWLDAMDVEGVTVDHASTLPTTLASKVFVNTDNNNAQEGLWEDDLMSSANFTINGLAYRWAPNSAFLYGQRDDPMTVNSLDLQLAGDPLAERPASQLGSLLRAVRPSKVKSDSPLVRLGWRDAENIEILNVTFPLNLKP